jgi:ATP synthase protein I
MLNQDKHVIELTVLGQVVVSIVLAAALWGLQGRDIGVSALLGGMTAAVPNAFLAGLLLLESSGRSARAMLAAAWVGEFSKLGLTAAMFAAVIVWGERLPILDELAPFGWFGGFRAAQLVVLGALLTRGGATNKEVTTKN